MKQHAVPTLLVTVSYLFMITVNALANILPLNGKNTGEVSDSYPNLFAPAGFTFSIWGLIYLLLGGFVLYQWKKSSSFSRHTNDRLLVELRTPFIVTCLSNAAWLFSWHYEWIALSTVFMGILLITLIHISSYFEGGSLSIKENLFLRVPFSVYFGWITVATVANITILLVKWNWDGFGLSSQFWTILILVVTLGIASAVIHFKRDLAYGLVIIWAFGGIIAKHLDKNGWNGQYPYVLYTLYACLAILILLLIYTGTQIWKNKNSRSFV